MATRTEAGLGRGRRFGIEVGLACLAVALWLSWHGAASRSGLALFGAGAVLLGIAAVSPRLLDRVASAWLIVGDRIAAIVTPVVVTLIYLVVITPFGVVRRRFGRSPIRRHRGAASYWVRRPPTTPQARRTAMEHQF